MFIQDQVRKREERESRRRKTPAGFVADRGREGETERAKCGAVHGVIVTGMSGMTDQFGSGLFLPPSFPLFLFSPLNARCCPLKLVALSLSVSLVLPVSLPSQQSFSPPVLSVLFLATLPSPGSVENVIEGQQSWWLSGFRHHE